jgi:hypothetical protein
MLLKISLAGRVKLSILRGGIHYEIDWFAGLLAFWRYHFIRHAKKQHQKIWFL